MSRRGSHRRSESPPLRKTRRAHLPSNPASTFEDAIVQVAQKDLKVAQREGRQPDEDSARRGATTYVTHVYRQSMDKLRRDFERRSGGQAPTGADLRTLIRSAERITVEEVEEDLKNNSALTRGRGHSTLRTAYPRTRAARFEQEEAAALAQQPPPPPNDITSLIEDFMERPPT
jgi:hypothetical protein